MSPLPTLKMFENVWNFKIGSFYVEENFQSGTFIYLQRNLSKNTPDFLKVIQHDNLKVKTGNRLSK